MYRAVSRKPRKKLPTPFYSGYARAVPDVGKERGWPAMTREKIARYSEALGGIVRMSFQMNAASLPRAKFMKAIATIGTRVAPLVRNARIRRPASVNAGRREAAWVTQ
jgi:hypothetical protein